MSKIAKRKDHNGRVLPDGVSHRKDGRYIYRYSIRGKEHYIYTKTLDEMKEEISRLNVDLTNGRNIDMSKLTLNEWYPQYCEIYKKGKIKDSTYQNMINYYNWYIRDYDVATQKIRDLKRTQLVAHFNMLAEKKGLAHGTLRSLASMLFNCLQKAVFDCGLFVNPATDIMKDVKARAKEERDCLTDEELGVLMSFLRIKGTFQNIYYPMIALLLETGLRFGECEGLTWDDIDMNRGTITVEKTMNYRDKGNGHEFFVTTPKTVNAYRIIPISENVVRLLKEQKRYQKDMRIRHDIVIDGYSNFVFTTKLGYPFTNEGFRKTLYRIVTHANEWESARALEEKRKPVLLNEKITCHWFRHTFATNLVLKEVPYDTAKMVMGHSSIKTTIDMYTHLKKKEMKKVRADIGDIVDIFGNEK